MSTLYRECLVQAHLVEQQCLNSELQTALNRVDNLSHQIDRLTEGLSSHKQALTRADSLNLRLTNQVNSLKTELTAVNDELLKERSNSNQAEPNAESVSTQLFDQQQTITILRAQLDSISAEKSASDKERVELKKAFEECENLLTRERKRAEAAEQQLMDLKANWKEASNALSKAVHSTSTNGSGQIPDSPLKSQLENLLKSSPEDGSTSGDLFHAISRAATNLAMARHTANKAERRARELQATNQSLRLSLAEAELRLMPLLVTVTNREPVDSTTPTTSAASSVRNTNSAVTNARESLARDRNQLNASSRFAELKGMCSRLLSLASAEDRSSPPPDNSDEAEDEEDDSPHSLLLSTISPNKTPVHRRHPHSDRSFSQSAAERDSGPFSPAHPVAGATIANSLTQSCIANPDHVERTFRNLHTRFLRSESYRRALTFQKRYLLLLLGGFQYSEETVLASICRPDSTVPVDTSPSSDGLPSPDFRVHPLRRFRVAVRAVQVIHRMHQMIHRWRRSGLHYSSSRAPGERLLVPGPTPTVLQNLPNYTQYAQFPWSRPTEPPRPPIMNLRTPLRELDVGTLGRYQPEPHVPSSQEFTYQSPYPNQFPVEWPESFYSTKPVGHYTAPSQTDDPYSAAQMAPPNTWSHRTVTTSSPLAANRSQTLRTCPGKMAVPRSADWATASTTTNTSQMIVRSGPSYTCSSNSYPINVHLPTRQSTVLCDTNSNHHVQFEQTHLRTRIPSAVTIPPGSERRRPAPHTPTAMRNGVSFSTRLQTNSRTSVPPRKTNATTFTRPCRQPPFK
ncbi:unnamed protein product [Echinostoma caproni]|uniref:PACT_coil_coil domain-containing protein n=1 Tax=Echinostoma caproni TaxID=27848 RepID=A0A183AQ92_9TREM|nr:unnamed protein product [Echinostoma caproni]